MKGRRLYGLMAEFATPGELLEATRQVYAAGYRKLDSHSPYPVEGLAEALGFTHNRLPLLVLIGGIVGAISGYALQYWTSVVDYPINVAGRPLNSWPAFVPVTFETAVLFAALAAVFGMLVLNGLPTPYHPVFNVASFAFASQDRFFLVVDASDELFDLERTRDFLGRLGAREVSDIDQDPS